jgi:siroheme decarboxylase
MDTLDSRILDALQNDFPLCQDPYGLLMSELGISSDELWSRIQRMLADKVIRRIGASIDSHKFGFCSTLAAVSVTPAAVERAAEIIGQFHEVTHSYLRRDDFNIWFTIIAPDSRRIDDILDQIRCSLSLKDSQVLNLPLKRLFKLDTRFNLAT